MLANGFQYLLDDPREMIHQPIAKELVRNIKSYFVTLLFSKMNRLDPGFKILLAELLSKFRERFLPQSIALSTPLTRLKVSEETL